MIIIAKKYGQFGNRLILFAYFIAFAIEHKVKIVNPAFDEYAENFQTIRNDIFCRYPPKSLLNGNRLIRILLYFLIRLMTIIKPNFIKFLTIRGTENYDLNSKEFIKLAKNNKYLFVQGWAFRDNVNLNKHADIIRDYFKPNEKIQMNITELIDNARQNCDVLIGVHVRHGDYKNWNDGKYFYELDEYAKIMERIEILFQNKKVVFLVCSNVTQDVKTLSKFRFIFCNNHFVQDLYSLAKCDYIIGPPSTYTNWASFYGNVPLYKIISSDAIIKLEDFKIYPNFD